MTAGTGPTDEVDDFARQLAADPDHLLVVITPGAAHPKASWSQVTAACKGRRQAVRLIPHGTFRAGLSDAGQQLADQLDRVVLAPDATAISAPGGALIIPAHAGTGWVRLRPRQPPLPGTRRFPAPWWEELPLAAQTAQVLSEPVRISQATVAEPLPGGIWLRSPDQDARVPEIRERLCARLTRPDNALVVVLGYPGSPISPISDITVLWNLLPEQLQRSVRFVSFRPHALKPTQSWQPAGGPGLGQPLADHLGKQVTIYAGLPTVDGLNDAAGARVRTIRSDGSLGWHLFASELAYQPQRPSVGAIPPAVTDHRQPVAGRREITQANYSYAPDLTLEVVQSGLWLRPASLPDCATDVRSRPADPDRPIIWFGPGTEPGAAVLDQARIDQMTRCAEEIRTLIDDESGATCLVRPIFPEPFPEPADLAPPQGAKAITRPVVRPSANGTTVPGTSATPRASKSTSGAAAHGTKPPRPPRIRLESGPVSEIATTGEFPLAVSRAGCPPSPAADPGGTTADGGESTPTSGAQAPHGGGVKMPETAGSARPAPVPPPEARLVRPQGDLSRERAWLRQAMARQHDAAANLVRSILPGLPGSPGRSPAADSDALSDLIAVRLYLNGRPQDLDEVVRTAKPGPHVPFGRCVASGLRYLPPYQGAVRLRATLTDGEWQWYGEQHLVTEWSFCPAISDSQTRLEGNVDFWVWSVTARRVNLLAPELPGQVIFLPGTTFKVLGVRTGERREVLMRELAATEIRPDGRLAPRSVPQDEAAQAGLNRAISHINQNRPAADLPAGLEGRFATAPGLLRTASGESTPGEGRTA